MQHGVVKEFENDSSVVTAVFNEGGRFNEDAQWLQIFWAGHYLRGSLFWDPNAGAGANYKQPSTGLPFGRGFLIDQQGKVALPYFGHRPRMVIQSIKALKGGGLSLTPSATTLSAAAGGPLDLAVSGSPIRADYNYVTGISLAGMNPGFNLGGTHVALNPDPLFFAALQAPSSFLFKRFVGTLDAEGFAAPALTPGPGFLPKALVGYKLSFAVAAFGARGISASPAVQVSIAP